MDIRFLRSQPEIRNNTLKFERDTEGRMFLRPTVGDVTRRFYNFPEAQSHVRNFMGITSVQSFTADTPIFGIHPQMRQTVQELTQAIPGAEVELLSFNVADGSSVQQVRELMEEGGGWLVPDDETARLLRVRTPEGSWTTEQIANHFAERYGQTAQVVLDEQTEMWQFADKFYKRAKINMNAKTFGALWHDPIKVGVIDAAQNMDIEAIRRKGLEAGLKGGELTAFIDNAIESAADGYNEGSLRLFNRLKEQHSSYLNEVYGYLNEANMMGADDVTISRLMEEVKKAEKSVKQLDDIITNRRGVFYMQHMGGTAEFMGDPTGEIAKTIRQINKDGIYLKGGLWLNPNLDDVDIVTSAFVDSEGKVRHGFKSEFRMAPQMVKQAYLDAHGLSRVYGTTSLTPKEAMDAYLDVQHASSYPEFVSRDIIEEGVSERSRYFREAIDAMSETDPAKRRIPAEFRQILESQLDSPDPAVRETAQNIMDFVARHPLSDDPHMMRRALDTMLQASLKDKGRGLIHPKIKLPDTIRAEIVPHWGAARIAGEDLPEVAPGYMRFHRSSGSWIVHEADFLSFGPAWGGPDFDDTVLGMLRYDRKAGEVVAPMIRQPQARGEWVYTRIHMDDDFLGEVIQKSLDQAEENLNFREVLNRKRYLDGDVEKLKVEYNHAVRAGKTKDALRLKTRLDSAMEGQQNAARQIDNLLSTALRPIEDMMQIDPITGKGKLPGRRGFDPSTGAYVGGKRVDFVDVDGTRIIRYEGESELLTYRIKSAASEKAAKEAARRTLSELTPEQRMQAFGGVMNRFMANVGPDSNVLGQWGNARMFYDHWLAWHEDAAIKHNLAEFLPKHLFEMETVVDIAVQGVRDPTATPAAIAEKVEEMTRGIIRASAEGVSRGLDTRIDPAILKHKASEHLVSQVVGEINEERAARNLPLMTLQSVAEGVTDDRTSLLMAPTDARATWSAMMQGVEQLREQVSDQIAELAYPSKILELSEVRESSQATRDAKRLIKSYKNAEARLSVRALISDLDAVVDQDSWGRYIEGATGMTKAQYNKLLQDEFLGAMLETFDTTDTGARVAGERTYAALARTMQIIEDSVYQSSSVVGQAMARVGIYADVLDWAGGQDITHAVSGDVYRAIGGFTRGPDLSLVIDDMLRGTDLSSEVLEWITKGIDVSGRGRGIELPENVLRQLAQIEGPTVVPTEGGRVFGPTDPRMLIRGVGARPGEALELGELAFLYQREGLDASVRQDIADSISRALKGFKGSLEDWAGEMDMPDRLRDYVIRSMERGPTPSGIDVDMGLPPGGEKAARARKAARQAADIAEVTPMKRGFRGMISELAGTRGGRGIMAGTAGLAAIAAIHSIKNKDVTINDMQGPAFMPGGNPYTDDPQAHGSQWLTGYGLAPPPAQHQEQGGTTYKVRTRGGQYDSDFANQVADITGGNVSGTTYDAGNPFQTRDIKQRILESYG